MLPAAGFADISQISEKESPSTRSVALFWAVYDNVNFGLSVGTKDARVHDPRV